MKLSFQNNHKRKGNIFMTSTTIQKITEKIFKNNLRRSQIKSLSAIVLGALRNNGGRLTDMARGMGPTTSVKHRVKRVVRFLGNKNILIEEQAPLFLSFLLSWLGGLERPIIFMDWTEEHDQNVLMFSLKYKKRSIPFYWVVVKNGNLLRSRNSTENTAVRLLKMWMGDQKFILICDRGFSRSSLYRELLNKGIYFIIRIPKSTHILSKEHKGALADVILHHNKVRDFSHATFLGADAKNPMRIIMKKAKIDGYWTTWYLATNVSDLTKTTIVNHYERRMGCEATFRDLKTTLGWRKQIGISDSTRLSRYILILTVALIIAILTAGRKIAQKYKSIVSLTKSWSQTQVVSDVQLGIWLIQYLTDRLTSFHPRKYALGAPL